MTISSEQKQESKSSGALQAIVDVLRRRLYSHRRFVAKTIYTAITTGAYGAAYLLRFELSVPPEYSSLFGPTLLLLLAIRLLCAYGFRLSTGRWRFVSTRDTVRLVTAVTTGSIAFYALTRLLPFERAVPVSIILIEAVLTIFGTAAVWITYRTVLEELRQRAGRSGTTRRVLIIGAGEAGNLLGREIMRYPTGYKLVGFIDDDPMMWGSSLHGIDIIGSTHDLAKISDAIDADELIIALPSATPSDLRRIVSACEGTTLPFKVLPGIKEVLIGKVRINQLREVRIEDLLGREPIQLELPELAEMIRDRCVMITGAAGSIGSELSRQIALHQPRTLILFDQAETDLFYLEGELRDKHPNVTIQPVIGDILNPSAVEGVFARETPDFVYHAAAYKHVPMMQLNPRVAVQNNVVGTWRVADAAGRYGAAKFVLVSTDKAVRPSSVMGATKRAAEMLILELQSQYADTDYSAVRFGNVLGSNGSVIPLFKRQLEMGKPLTVTHPDATRYFMTIPEAVQLILQASLVGDLRGQIAMLEMGEPVRILDLAKHLLRLSGVGGDANSRVIFTGLRPGEKLHEELVAPDEVPAFTDIPKVRIVDASRNGTATFDDMIRAGFDDEDLVVEQVLDQLLNMFPGILDAPAHKTRVSRPVIHRGITEAAQAD